MRFNGRIAGIAAGITTAVYIMLPNIDEGRTMQVLTFAALYYIAALGCAWAADELVRIQRKRNSLDIMSKRPTRGNRDRLPTDIKIKRGAWVISFPVEKVVD